MVEKTCAFYVSDAHLAAMIIPYTNKQMQKNNIIETFLENNLKQNVEALLSKLILNEKIKNKIKNVNWKSYKLQKYLIEEEKIINIINNKNKEINFLISGNIEYINNINNILNRVFEKNKTTHKYIRIINCYSVDLVDNNIQEIIQKHDTVLNTAGIKKIEDIFEKYENENKISV